MLRRHKGYKSKRSHYSSVPKCVKRMYTRRDRAKAKNALRNGVEIEKTRKYHKYDYW